MPIYDIEAPGGKILSIEAPDEQQALAGAQQWHAQQGGGQQPAAEQPQQAPGYSGGGGILPAVSGAARGFNKALTDVVGAPGALMDMAAVPIAKKLGLVDQDREHIFGGADATARRGLDAVAHAAGLNPDAKMAYEQREELPKDQRVAAAAGEALGNAVPFAAGLGAASLGANLSAGAAPASLGKELVRHIAANPRAYAATEAMAAGGAAQGSAIGQQFDNALDNGSHAVSDVGQLVGSIVNPGGALINASKGVKNAVVGGLSNFSPAAAESRAAAHLSKLLNEGGEDAAKIAKNIDTNAADPLAAPFSAADRSQSPTLLGLQNRIAADNPDFAKVVEARRAEGMTNLRNTAESEFGGDPAALTRTADDVRGRVDRGFKAHVERAQDRHDATVGAIQDDVSGFTRRAEQQAQEGAAPFARDAEAQNIASGQARGALDEAYAADKAQEKALWGKLDLSQKVVPTNFRKAIGEAERALLPGESLPEPIREIARIAKTRKGLQSFTAEGVQNVRSRLLTLKRAEDAGSGDGIWGHVYGKMADGLLEDLAQVPGSAEARAYTRGLHDKWTRTYAGDTQRVTGTGADKVGEMSTLSKAMSGTDAERAGKFAALRTAAGDNADAMHAAQEAYLQQHAAGKITDPLTGGVRPAAAAKYAEDNATLLSPFPQLRQQLEEAARTGQALRTVVPEYRAAGEAAIKEAGAQLKGVVTGADRTRAILDQHAAFSRVLKAGERPERAVTAALTGNNPTRDMRALSALARRGGDDAIGGLRSATLDHTFAQAGKQADKAGGFWHAVGDQLNSPLATGKPNLLSALTGNRVLNTTGAARLLQIVRRGQEIEKADAAGRYIANAGPKDNAIIDQLIRTAGAKYGANVSIFGHLGHAGLSAASYGTRTFRHYLQDMPSQKAVDLLQKALGDDVLMKKLLSKVTPAKEPGLLDALKRELGDFAEGRKTLGAAARSATGASRDAAGEAWRNRPATPLHLRVTPRSATMGAYSGLLN